MEAATIKIDNSLIEGIIKAEVVAAIGKALGSRDEMIQSVVAGALAIKVNGEGKPDSYAYRNSKTYLEWFVEKTIRESAGEAIQEYMNEIKPKMRAELVRQLKKSQSIDSIASALVLGLERSIESEYYMNVSVNLHSPEKG
jgi:F0F1-type ATP synthase membrane subunit b/b'